MGGEWLKRAKLGSQTVAPVQWAMPIGLAGTVSLPDRMTSRLRNWAEAVAMSAIAVHMQFRGNTVLL